MNFPSLRNPNSTPPPSMIFAQSGLDLWPYRRRTTALLRRYARASVEVGRIPSLLGREFFRTRVSSYTMRNFEDVVIFVADMERALDKLNGMEKKVLAMHVLEEYTVPECSRLLGCSQRTAERFIEDSLDQLSETLLSGGLLEPLPVPTRGERLAEKACQAPPRRDFAVSPSKQSENNSTESVGAPQSDLIS